MSRWRSVIGFSALAAVMAGAPVWAEHLPKGDPARGEELYNGTCVACHGPSGTGAVPGVPDLTKADGPLSKPEDVLFTHMREGFNSGGGMAMPPKGGNPALGEQDLVDILAYLRAKFGGK